jgi:hypothetical protein
VYIIKRISSFIFLQAPFYLLYPLTLAFVIAVFKLPDEEAMQMLNISFPVVGILAGIAFSWAQCLKEDARKEKALLASKQFFHSLILLFLTILLKYISFVHVPGITIPYPAVIVFKILIFYSLGVTVAFFMAALHTTRKHLWLE